jgi:hypothetical protein
MSWLASGRPSPMCALLPRSRSCQLLFQIAVNPIRKFAENPDPGRDHASDDKGLNDGFKQ